MHSLTPKRPISCFGCATFVLLVVILVSQGFCRWYSIRFVLGKIVPGMSYEQVVSTIPKRFVHSDREESSWAPKTACLAHTNAQICSRMYITSVITPITPDEVAFIYFDKQDLVIGIYYNSSSGNGYWKPKWSNR